MKNVTLWTVGHIFLSTNLARTGLSGMVRIPLIYGLTSSASEGWRMSNCCTILANRRWSSNSAIRRPRHIRVPNPNGMEENTCLVSLNLLLCSRNHLSGLNASGSGNTGAFISTHVINKEIYLSTSRNMVSAQDEILTHYTAKRSAGYSRRVSHMLWGTASEQSFLVMLGFCLKVLTKLLVVGFLVYLHF